jgi:hypothetical protein
MERLLGLILAATAGLALATTVSAEPLRIRGTIVATSPDSLTVHTANGNVTTSLNAKTGFVSVVPELTAVSVAPAIANAIYHATGKRVRDLPITVEKLL